MVLMTEELKELINQNPLYSHDGEDAKDVKILCKYFVTGSRYTFYVTEGEIKENGDVEFFGYCKSPLGSDCDEFGYMWLSQLKEINILNENGLMIADMEICNNLSLEQVIATEEVI